MTGPRTFAALFLLSGLLVIGIAGPAFAQEISVPDIFSGDLAGSF